MVPIIFNKAEFFLIQQSIQNFKQLIDCFKLAAKPYLQNSSRICITHHKENFFLSLLTFVLLLPAYAQVKPSTADERLKGMDKRKLLKQRSLLKDIKFRNIGPSVMSGRVVDVDVNPDDPTEFYVAYATGGLWHTTNNGQSLTPIFDTEDVIGIGDIAVNWQGKTRTIWIGTGEVNSSRSSYAGIGIYRSNNNGTTWEYLGLPESHHIGKIQLHPADNNTAWVAVLGHLYSPNKERGVYKTTDGGKLWKQTLFIDNNTGAVDLDINPLNPKELYASMWYKTRSAWDFTESGKSSGIYKSIDGGEIWQLITKEGSGFPAGEGVGRTGVAVYPKNPQIIYAVIDNQFRRKDTASEKKDTVNYTLNTFLNINKEQFLKLQSNKLDTFLKKNNYPVKYTAAQLKEMVGSGVFKPTVLYDYQDIDQGFTNRRIYGCQVYKSINGGLTWEKKNDSLINTYNTYGYYFGKIYVSPYNENKVVITGYDIQLSLDGGKSFKLINKENVHADHHALWINPKRDSHMINGNDGGCNITYDDGNNWFKANTPSVAQYYAIAVDDSKPYNVYGGLQDNGTWVGPSTNKESIGWVDNGQYPFKGIGGGDGMQVQVDTRDNQTVYSGFQFGTYFRQLREKKEIKNIKPSHDLGEAPLRFNWQSPIHLSKHNEDVLYFGTNRFFRSLNKGENMRALSNDLTKGKKEGDVPYGTLTTITESPLKFGLLYVGSDDGNIQHSKDGGYTWTLINKNLPQGLYISRVTASAFKEGRVYASLNGYRNDHFSPYLYVSDDFGMNWKQIGKDLPHEPINVVKEDTKYDSILYVGTDGGLYVSIDAGNSFMMWHNGLPSSVPVHDIAIQQRENEIILGTHGRSLYISKLDSVQLLLQNPGHRQKKQAETNKLQSVLSGVSKSEFLKKEGIDVECPPVNNILTRN
jgi:photosystem II stability/assembly factor-like uncharacterized protein